MKRELFALTQFKQFTVYNLRPNKGRPGKMDKVTIDPVGLFDVNAHDPSNWLSFDDALSKSFLLGDEYGVGFTFTKDDPFFFVDIDHCLIDNEWSPIAIELCDMFKGAALEISSSRTGLHIIGSGKPPEHSCKNSALGIEFYTSGRFVALTGFDIIGDASLNFTNQLNQLTDKYFPANAFEKVDDWTTEPTEKYGERFDNETIIESALKSKSSRSIFGTAITFKDLWTRNIEKLSEAFPDDTREFDYSRADSALASHLMFYTGGNCEHVHELMNLSALKRSKWEQNKTYLKKFTIGKTYSLWLSSGAKFYTGKRSLIERQPPPNDSIVDGMGSGLEIGKNWEYFHIGFSDCKANGKPKGTFLNFKIIIDKAKIIIKYNMLSKDIDIILPGASFLIDNHSNNAISLLISLCIQVEFPVDNIKNFIMLEGDTNAYNPALNWVKSVEWDGVDRIIDLVKSLDAKHFDVTLLLIRKWLTTAIRALINPNGVASHGVLVLQGEQGAGKTEWFWSLTNRNREFAKEGIILNPSDRDSVKQCVKYWLVELGELDATFRRADIAALKAFITRDSDEFRAPYAHKESCFPRKTVFFASVNPREYLHDDTGNRRYWTIECGENLNPRHGINMQQLWMQILKENGAVDIFLSSDEKQLLNNINDDFAAVSTLEDMFHSNYDMNSVRSRVMTTTEILNELEIDPLRSRRASTEIAKILKVKSWYKSNGRKVFNMPRKLNNWS